MKLVTALGDTKRAKHVVVLAVIREGTVQPTGVIVPSENAIAFEDAMVVTPANATLVRDLNLSVPAGTNLLVTGPNGSGKSSLFRVLGGLWPLSKGRIHKPGGSEGDGLSHDIFYVPQRPYVTLGTLEEQLIYPLVASGWRHCILLPFWVSFPVCLSGVVCSLVYFIVCLEFVTSDNHLC